MDWIWGAWVIVFDVLVTESFFPRYRCIASWPHQTGELVALEKVDLGGNPVMSMPLMISQLQTKVTPPVIDCGRSRT